MEEHEPIEGTCLVKELSYIYSIKLDCFKEYFYGCGGDGMLFRYDMSLAKVENFYGCDSEVWNFVLDEDND